MSFLRSYETAMAKYTDAPEIYHRACATGLAAAMLTTHRNRCLLAGGIKKRYTTMWVMLVGDSGHSRKTTCVNMASAVLSETELGVSLRSPDDGSPEGFAKDLIRRENNRAGDAAHLMVAPELTNFMSSLTKEYMRNAKFMLMEFHDGPDIWRKMLSKEEYTLTYPRFSLIGAIATELIPTNTLSEDWAGGFLNRALIIYDKPSRVQRESKTPPNSLMKSLAKELDGALKCWRLARAKRSKDKKAPQTFDYDAKGLKLKQQLEDSLPVVNDGNVRMLFARSDLHLHKLAAVEQVMMDPESPVITAAAVDAASVLWLHWHRTAGGLMSLAFARTNADMEGDRLARRMMRLLNAAGEKGIEEMVLMENVILDYEKFTKTFTTLEMAGKAIKVAGDDGKVLCKWVG